MAGGPPLDPTHALGGATICILGSILGGSLGDFRGGVKGVPNGGELHRMALLHTLRQPPAGCSYTAGGCAVRAPGFPLFLGGWGTLCIVEKYMVAPSAVATALALGNPPPE